MCYLSDNIVIYSTIASIPQRNNDPLLKFRKKCEKWCVWMKFWIQWGILKRGYTIYFLLSIPEFARNLGIKQQRFNTICAFRKRAR